LATTARNRRLEPAYKQHTVVDDVRGVILDVEVTTGELNEGQVVVERIDATMATTGLPITTVTADAGYAYAKVYGALERRGIDALIPTKAEPIRSAVPLRRFRYDAKNDVVKCPRGKILRPALPIKHGRFFYSRAKDCARCPLAKACLSRGRLNKAVMISDHYPALLRARRRRERWSADVSTSATAGGPKVSTVRPRPGTGSARAVRRGRARCPEHAHPGVSDPLPRSTWSGSPPPFSHSRLPAADPGFPGASAACCSLIGTPPCPIPTRGRLQTCHHHSLGSSTTPPGNVAGPNVKGNLDRLDDAGSAVAQHQERIAEAARPLVLEERRRPSRRPPSSRP
jgi:Transposase DDE domain